VIPIEQLMSDLGRAVANAMADSANQGGLLKNPAHVADILMQGEQRRLANQTAHQTPVPRFCIFSVTWRCNLRCVGCYARNYIQHGDMPIETIAQVIRQGADLGCYLFVIVGGEPLLAPNLIKILADTSNALFFLFTNGTLMTSQHADALVQSSNILPIISVEGDQDSTDHRRGLGVGAKVADCMKLLASRGVLFGFSSMVSHRNLSQVTSRQWFDLLWDAGARLGFLIDYVPFDHNLDVTMMLTPHDRLEKQKAVALRYAEARPLVMNFPPAEYDWGTCQSAGTGFMHINADGYVEPCPFFHYAADNVKDKPLVDILRSSFFTELRRVVQTLPNPDGECLLHKHEATLREIVQNHGAFVTEQLAAK